MTIQSLDRTAVTDNPLLIRQTKFLPSSLLERNTMDPLSDIVEPVNNTSAFSLGDKGLTPGTAHVVADVNASPTGHARSEASSLARKRSASSIDSNVSDKRPRFATDQPDLSTTAQKYDEGQIEKSQDSAAQGRREGAVECGQGRGRGEAQAQRNGATEQLAGYRIVAHRRETLTRSDAETMTQNKAAYPNNDEEVCNFSNCLHERDDRNQSESATSSPVQEITPSEKTQLPSNDQAQKRIRKLEEKLRQQASKHKSQVNDKTIRCKKKIEDVKLEYRTRSEKLRHEHATHKKNSDEEVRQAKAQLKTEKEYCKQIIEEEKRECKKQIHEVLGKAKKAARDQAEDVRTAKADFKKALKEAREKMQDEVRNLKSEHSAEIKSKNCQNAIVALQIKLAGQDESLRLQSERLAAMEREIEQREAANGNQQKIVLTMLEQKTQQIESMSQKVARLQMGHAKERAALVEQAVIWRNRAQKYSNIADRRAVGHVDVQRANAVLQSAHTHNLSRIGDLESTNKKLTAFLARLQAHGVTVDMKEAESEEEKAG